MSEKSFRLFENMIVTRAIPFVSIFIAMAYYLESLKVVFIKFIYSEKATKFCEIFTKII